MKKHQTKQGAPPIMATADLQGRSEFGDVGEVWRRMRRQFSRVAGVLGNHDQFGDSARPSHRPEGFLDGAILEMNGLRVGGVSGIVGDSGRANRRSPDEFAEPLITVLVLQPDILLLHAAPETDEGAPGDASIADWIRSTDFAGLIVCGHVHWDERVQRCGRATVLNVDGTVVTLVPAS
ncbi:MAG: metallophosphoesterase [Opitutaceae bacterium]